MTSPQHVSGQPGSQLVTAWHALGTTNATGAITFAIPAGTFTFIGSIQAQAVRDTVAPSLAAFALVRSYTLTSVVIQVFESRTIALGSGDGLELATAALPVFLTVWGY